MENPIKMDDLWVPIFLETPTYMPSEKKLVDPSFSRPPKPTIRCRTSPVESFSLPIFFTLPKTNSYKAPKNGGFPSSESPFPGGPDFQGLLLLVWGRVMSIEKNLLSLPTKSIRPRKWTARGLKNDAFPFGARWFFRGEGKHFSNSNPCGKQGYSSIYGGDITSVLNPFIPCTWGHF